jgi:hypothetical protein
MMPEKGGNKMPLGNKWSPERRRKFETKRALLNAGMSVVTTTPPKRRTEGDATAAMTLNRLVEEMEYHAKEFQVRVTAIRNMLG